MQAILFVWPIKLELTLHMSAHPFASGYCNQFRAFREWFSSQDLVNPDATVSRTLVPFPLANGRHYPDLPLWTDILPNSYRASLQGIRMTSHINTHLISFYRVQQQAAEHIRQYTRLLSDQFVNGVLDFQKSELATGEIFKFT